MSSSHEGMTSNRPYLLRALYEWINDNGLTPHILVNAELDGVDVVEPESDSVGNYEIRSHGVEPDPNAR